MKTLAKKLPISILLASTAVSPLALAEHSDLTSGIKKALSDSKVNVAFRARYEMVNQDLTDGSDIDANALMLKSRLSLKTGALNGFSLGVEVDNNTAIVDDYNDGTFSYSGNDAVVADPEYTDVNQAYIQYKNDKLTATAGRQRILHNNQRFVGGVAWRQNEQTYDGYRIQYKASDAFSLDYSYVYNVNRIFVEDSKKTDNFSGNLHLANATYKINKSHKLSGFAYLLDIENAAASSTNTYGVLYNGKFNNIMVNASYASQTDAGDNTKNFDTSYYNIELGTKLEKVTLLAGMEVLGSDDGNVAFSTPLATLHKFQGFADKFLGTPANGVEDIYVTAKTAINGVKLAATYHDLSSNEGGIDYGSEIDLVAAYKIDPACTVLVKFANYSADNFSTDTNKLWLQLAAKF